MRCQKCGNEFSGENAVCPKCNYKNDTSYLKYLQDDQVKANLNFYNDNKESFKNQTATLSINSAAGVLVEPNLEYLLAYIGDNYDSFQKGGFSWCCFFFGDFYLIYRKLYLVWGLKFLIRIALFLSILVLYINSNFEMSWLILLLFFFDFVVEILPSFLFKSFYYKYASSKVNQILKANPNMSKKELLDICQKKGGTSIITAVIFFLILFWSSNLFSSVSEYMVKNETRIRNLTFQSTNYLDLDSSYPANFERIILDECYIRVATVQNDSRTLERYIQEDIFKTNLSTITINDYNWKYYKEGNKNYYYTENNGVYYKLITEVKNDNFVCKKSIDTVLDSLQFK